MHRWSRVAKEIESITHRIGRSERYKRNEMYSNQRGGKPTNGAWRSWAH